MSQTRVVRAFGDSALIVEAHNAHEAHSLAISVRRAHWDGLEDVVIGHRSLTVIADPRVVELFSLADELSVIEAATETGRKRRTIEIPVALDGPDLAEVAEICATSEQTVRGALLDADLEVEFLGFSPGFAYLGGLPEMLQRVARRRTPRAAVPAGSLAVAGGFAAFYPQRSPGGWQLVGRTDLRFFDPETSPFALLQPGDRVRLVPAAPPPPPALEAAANLRAPLESAAPKVAEVEKPGMMSLVEDAGRVGLASLGVPRAGPADPFSMRLANRLVGNRDDAPVIEVTTTGPALRVRSDSQVHVAVVGDVDLHLDGLPVATDAVLPVEPGQLLQVGSTRRGLRAYVSFCGGVEIPPVMGSRSSDLLCGLGPGPLRAGDVLGIGPPTRPHGRLERPSSSLETGLIRLIAGPDEFPDDQLRNMARSAWKVKSQSDRVGVRLDGEPLRPPNEGIPSRGSITGALQVPGDGRPIALLCDHATVGGYPVVATVIRADIGRLGQLSPGDEVRFELVGAAEAAKALEAAERDLDRQVSGWYPVRAD